MAVSLLFIAVCTALAVGAMLAFRRYLAPPGGHLHDVPSGPGTFGVVGTGFAVLLAFVIFGSFGSYQAARDYSGAEAVAVRQLYSTSDYFSAPTSAVLHGELICYARAVAEDEWSLMQESRESPAVVEWVDRMDQTLQAAPVGDAKQAAALGHWLSQSQDRQESRRGRLAEAQPFVPGFLWIVLCLLVVAVLTFQVMFVDPMSAALGQAVAMGAITATLVSGLVLIWVLDRPFNDRGAAIAPTRMNAAEQAMEADYAESGTTTPLPCSASGQPTGG